MARLPTVGGDVDNWGAVLNEFLQVSHASDGRLQVADAVVTSDQATISATMANPLVGDQIATLQLNMKGKGTGATGEGSQGLAVLMQDDAAIVNKAITGAANNGSGLIRITATGHTFATGDRIAVYGVGGVPNANGKWTITVINANAFDLQGSTFAGTYTSGGTATNRPYQNGIYVAVAPTLTRGGLTGTAANGDDLNGIAVQNGSATSMATDGVHIATSPVSPSWAHGFTCDADVQVAAFQFTGDLTGAATEGVNATMIDLGYATATGGGFSIRLPNNVPVAGRNSEDTADVWMFALDTAEAFQFYLPVKFANSTGISFGSATDMNFDTGTGTKIGTATSQKLGFWNATPVVRPAGWGAPTGTATRTTFATGSVTTAQLAERVKALIDDLTTIGLIGS